MGETILDTDIFLMYNIFGYLYDLRRSYFEENKIWCKGYELRGVRCAR